MAQIKFIASDTKLKVVKSWRTPYSIVNVGNHAPAYYWAEKLGKSVDKFMKDINSGVLDKWFEIYNDN